MKISDLSMLFVMVFLCGALGLGLQELDMERGYVTGEVLHTQLDRIAEDVLMDVAVEEAPSGEVRADEEKIYLRFAKLLRLAFDGSGGIPDEAAAALRYYEYDSLSSGYTAAQSAWMAEKLERALNAQANLRRDAHFYEVTFPLAARDRWYQGVAGPTFLSVFEPQDQAMPWERLDRARLSGSRMEKRRRQTR